MPVEKHIGCSQPIYCCGICQVANACGEAHRMQPTHLLLRCGELFLKGGNRGTFEKRLRRNLCSAVGIPIAGEGVKSLRGRLIISYFPNHQLLRRVFGLTSYSPAVQVPKEEADILQAALRLSREYAAKNPGANFKVETKRSDKRFHLTSLEMNRKAGMLIEKETDCQFSLSTPGMVLGIEINQDAAYLFLEKIPCFGGMPAGVEGGVAVLLEDEASILAGILMMKRGCAVYPVRWKGEQGITGENPGFVLLQAYSPQKLQLPEVSDAASLQQFVQEKNLTALATGERLETLKDGGAFGNVAVFRPLVGYGPEEIKTEIEKFKAACAGG